MWNEKRGLAKVTIVYSSIRTDVIIQLHAIVIACIQMHYVGSEVNPDWMIDLKYHEDK